MGRVLILYATREGQTEKVARRIGAVLEAEGHSVELLNAKDHAKVEAASREPFDYLLCGASMHAGGLESELRVYLRNHRSALKRQPRALFVVLLSAATSDPTTRSASLADARNKIAGQLAVPFDNVELIAGALRYSKYSWPMKWIMQKIARAAGSDTDTTRDYEYTNWAQVEDFARNLPIGSSAA